MEKAIQAVLIGFMTILGIFILGAIGLGVLALASVVLG